MELIEKTDISAEYLNPLPYRPFYAGPNLTPAYFTLALIPPLVNFGLTSFRAVDNAIKVKYKFS